MAAVVASVGIVCAAIAIDTGTWFVQMEKAQRAADAAALGGVPFLPQDFAAAKARALEITADNGFDDASDDVVVDVQRGAKSTQLVVTVQRRTPNQFGTMFGADAAVIHRSGTAEYRGPAPMGSPCNTFGNEPDAGRGPSGVLPTGTALGTQPTAPLPPCVREPSFWSVIEGPETTKQQGDRYQTLRCGKAGVDGCDANQKNVEYDEFGYVLLVKVQPAAVNTDIALQLYDPLFTNTERDCSLLPAVGSGDTQAFADDTRQANPWVRNDDARSRYTRNGSATKTFCAGDAYAEYTTNRMVTSFVLREQTDSQNPKAAAVQSSTSGQPCIKQYGGYGNGQNAISANVFKDGSAGYNAQVAELFHNWSTLCTFRPTRAGDYYLQVRSNVALGGTGTGLVRTGTLAAAAATGNLATGSGANAFSVRAVTAAGKESAVAVSGFDHMPIYVNSAESTPEFKLIRILPTAAGQKISFSYFDAGDAASSGYVRILRPTDATGSITSSSTPQGCTSYGGSAGGSADAPTTLGSDCRADFVKVSGSSVSKNDGKAQTITIPIPTDYACQEASLSGCWFRVQIGFGTGSVSDVTTWDATVQGDPVRLVR